MPHPYFETPPPLVIGHRGAAGEVPENTIASFRHALACGAHVLESDVHITRDGVPVLCHDAGVDRTTEGRGPIGGKDLATLQQLDAGHRFEAEGDEPWPHRGRGLRIPTLREAFEALPQAAFNLELKDERPDLVQACVSLVAEFERADRTLLTAAEDGTMKLLREEVAARALPVALGACTGEVVAFVRATVEGSTPPSGPMALQIPETFAGRPLVTPDLIQAAHRHDVSVHVWTINEPASMRRLLDLGVDGIVTDFPARLARVIAQR
jgi:glycerophosphoryl diester phosphodiesterase